MSTKIYTSASANKWGIVEPGSKNEYEVKSNHSCFVLLIGLSLVAAIAVFIFTHI